MEFVISLAVIGKILAFFVVSFVVAVVTLFPSNDRNVSAIQVAVFIVIEAVLLAAFCGVISFKLTS